MQRFLVILLKIFRKLQLDFSQNQLLTPSLSLSNDCSTVIFDNLLIPTHFASTGHILYYWLFSKHSSLTAQNT